MRQKIIQALSIACGALVSLSSVAAPATGEPITIAASLDLSGAAADVGQDVLEGTEHAISVINQNGGVLGRPLVLKYQDNGTNAPKSVNQATSLVRNGADFLLGPQSSANAIAVSKSVSGPLKMPMCSSSANADDLTIKAFQPYVFAMSANSVMEQRAIAERLAKEPHKRYAVVGADYAAGRANANRFKQYIKELNPQAEIVAEEYPKFGASDYTASINKVLASKPDYVWTVLFGPDLITFTKQAKSIGFFEKIQNRFLALYDGNTLKALGENAAVGTDGWQRAPANVFATSAAGKEYAASYRAKLGHYPSDWASLGYDCISIWAQAANKAKSLAADAVMAVIESSTFDSPRGAFGFAKYDHQGNVPIYLGKVAQSKEFGQPVLDIKEVVPGSAVRPSEKLVSELRAEK